MRTPQATPEAVVVAIAESEARRLSPRDSVDPDVTLHVFRHLRRDPYARRQYLQAAGPGCDTGFETGHAGKAALNLKLGRRIKAAIGADNDQANCPIEGDEPEFIESYTRFKVRAPRPRR